MVKKKREIPEEHTLQILGYRHGYESEKEGYVDIYVKINPSIELIPWNGNTKNMYLAKKDRIVYLFKNKEGEPLSPEQLYERFVEIIDKEHNALSTIKVVPR